MKTVSSVKEVSVLAANSFGIVSYALPDSKRGNWFDENYSESADFLEVVHYGNQYGSEKITLSGVISGEKISISFDDVDAAKAKLVELWQNKLELDAQ